MDNKKSASPTRTSPRKRSKHGHHTVSVSVVLSVFFSAASCSLLLVVFDPLVSPSQPSAIHADPEHSSSGHRIEHTNNSHDHSGPEHSSSGHLIKHINNSHVHAGPEHSSSGHLKDVLKDLKHINNSHVHAQPEHSSSGHLKHFNNSHVESASLGRERVLQLLHEAGIDNLSPEQIHKLPKWQHVVDLYGEDVVIVGKDRCDDFKKRVPSTDRKVGVAGLFNTGTNLFFTLMKHNLHGVKIMWQVPGGKHAMAISHDLKENVFPIVIVRDPLAWFQSQCSRAYSVHWRRGKHHCPNFIPNDDDRKQFENLEDVFPASIRYNQQSIFEFTSLAHLYSEWYKQYMDVDYPVLFIRFEDLVFSPRVVLSEIADCVGATIKEPFQFQVATSKPHGSGTNYVQAIVKTGNAELRMHNLTQADREYAQEHLDPRLVDIFHYHGPMTKIASS